MTHELENERGCYIIIVGHAERITTKYQPYPKKLGFMGVLLTSLQFVEHVKTSAICSNNYGT